MSISGWPRCLAIFSNSFFLYPLPSSEYLAKSIPTTYYNMYQNIKQAFYLATTGVLGMVRHFKLLYTAHITDNLLFV